MSIALIDGDIVVYQAAVKAQKEDDWGDGAGVVKTVDTRAAISAAHRIIADWLRRARLKTPIICFSSKLPKFREFINPTYKSHRQDPKPDAYWRTVEAMENAYQFFRIDGLEADDTMGILATSDRYRGACIVSLDKDMKTIPALLFNPNKDVRPRQVRPLQATHWWFMQTLMGDATDGYPGCPGIGPVKAETILGYAGQDTASMWRAVVEAFEEKGLTEEDAILQARMARILHRSDYDKDNGAIKLWHPENPETLSLATVTSPTSSVSTASPEAASPPSPDSSSPTTGTPSSSSQDPSRPCSPPSSRRAGATRRTSSGASKGTSRKSKSTS